MNWLIDLGVTMVVFTFWSDLLAANPLLAWGVALVGLFYLMNMFNEMVESYTGQTAW